MAQDVVEDLKTYGEYADRKAPAILIEEVTRRGALAFGTTVKQTDPVVGRRRGLAVALAAAVFVIVAIASIPLLFGGTQSEVSTPDIQTTLPVPPTTTATVVPTDDATPTTTAAIPTTPPTPPAILALSEGWSLAYVEVNSGSIRAALDTSDGQILLAGMGPHLAVSKDDGSTWDAADSSRFVQSQAGFISGGAATNGDLVVVAGRTCELQGDAQKYEGEPYEPFPCPQEPAIWSSSDLQNWSRVDVPETILPTCVGITAECYAGIEHMVGTTSGFLATGTFTIDADPSLCTRYAIDQLVLTSGDGLSWMGHTAPEPATVGLQEWQEAWDDPDCVVYRSLVPLGMVGGRWLATLRFEVAFDEEPDVLDLDGSAVEWSDDWGQFVAQWQQLVWFDEQQSEWTISGMADESAGPLAAAQIPGTDGIVLGGSTAVDCPGVCAAIWLTDDGSASQRAVFIGGAPSGNVLSIGASDAGFVALIGNGEHSPPMDSAQLTYPLWASIDGYTWYRVDLPEEVQDPYLVAASDALVLVAWTEVEHLVPATIDDDGVETFEMMTDYAAAVWVWNGS